MLRRRPVGEVFQAGEPVRAGLDGVPGLVQELADVADALVDRLRPDAGQGGDGGLGQGKALVQDDGQDAVGQGEDGRRPTPGVISRGRWPRRLSRLVSRCWSCGVISAAIRASRCWAGRPVSTGWQSQARSGLGRSNGPGRELLEELQNERIERNLAARLYNRRGLTTRDPEEGGKEERALADQYRAQASTFSDSWSQTAVELRTLASMYDTDAREEETRAERLRQGQRK